MVPLSNVRLGEKYELDRRPGVVFTVTEPANRTLTLGQRKPGWLAEFQDNTKSRRIHHFEEPDEEPGSFGLLPHFE